MENTKKKGKGLVITLAIFMVAFATCAALLFTGVVKSPLVEEKKCETKCDTKTTDDTKKTDTKADTKTDATTEKTADERYKDYINNLSKSIEKQKITSHYSTNGGYSFQIIIDNNKNLLIGGDAPTFNRMANKVADGVIDFFITGVGNGGFHSIYYLNTNGELYRASLETSFENNQFEFEKVEVKNIVGVKPIVTSNGVEAANSAAFIDIDGNVITE